MIREKRRLCWDFSIRCVAAWDIWRKARDVLWCAWVGYHGHRHGGGQKGKMREFTVSVGVLEAGEELHKVLRRAIIMMLWCNTSTVWGLYVWLCLDKGLVWSHTRVGERHMRCPARVWGHVDFVLLFDAVKSDDVQFRKVNDLVRVIKTRGDAAFWGGWPVKRFERDTCGSGRVHEKNQRFFISPLKNRR